jgi:hypothetical protein
MIIASNIRYRKVFETWMDNIYSIKNIRIKNKNNVFGKSTDNE